MSLFQKYNLPYSHDFLQGLHLYYLWMNYTLELQQVNFPALDTTIIRYLHNVIIDINIKKMRRLPQSSTIVA